MTPTTEPTLFDLPTVPSEFGVILSSPDLRKLDFSALDYTTARRAIIEYIQTYFPDDFNDFVASNGIIMIMEILSATTGKLSLRQDILANEGTLPTSQTEIAVVNHLALINQRIKRQTPATVDIQVSVDQPVLTDVQIDAGTSFQTVGSDKAPVNYEIYRAPGDWTSQIVIPAGKRGVIAYGLEGSFASVVTVTSAGGPNQTFTVDDTNILDSPMFVTIQTGNTIVDWKVITEPIERYGPTDQVVEVNFIDTSAIFRFGDNVTGQAPLSGSIITFKYRVGGGVRGRIGVNQINTTKQFTPLPPANAVTTVQFQNLTPSSGGTDKETIARAKKRAPGDFSLQRSIVTANDYAQAANSFIHPVFGAVSKSVAAIRTGLNANRVEIYILSDGPDGLPTTSNAGLKTGLATFFSNLNVLTDNVVILDGAIKTVDLEVTAVINRSVDASVIKTSVESAITNYFDVANWQMGQALYISNLIEAIKSVDGVLYVDLFKPNNNVIPTGLIADPSVSGVGFNEIIILGKRTISYYYDRNPQPSGLINQ